MTLEKPLQIGLNRKWTFATDIIATNRIDRLTKRMQRAFLWCIKIELNVRRISRPPDRLYSFVLQLESSGTIVSDVQLCDFFVCTCSEVHKFLFYKSDECFHLAHLEFVRNERTKRFNKETVKCNTNRQVTDYRKGVYANWNTRDRDGANQYQHIVSAVSSIWRAFSEWTISHFI